MNDPTPSDFDRPLNSASDAAPATLAGSSIFKLFEAFIALRERNDRHHKLFEQAMAKSRDSVQASFNSFAADTQRAYQQLRQEIHGEKRVSLVLLNELLEAAQDLEHIVAARPVWDGAGHEPQGPENADALLTTLRAFAQWSEAVEVEMRKLQAALLRHGIHPYDAVIGSLYDPKLHERVGSRRMEGMDPLRIAEQREHGYASQQPEFVLRRPKVIVSE
jgi:molecular chaperone GrpE (heat shock protein)